MNAAPAEHASVTDRPAVVTIDHAVDGGKLRVASITLHITVPVGEIASLPDAWREAASAALYHDTVWREAMEEPR
jgi:hypothetical protein